MIYVFGNSHAHLFTNSKPATFGRGENSNKVFTSYSLGPVIAYNFYEHHYPGMIDIINGIPFDKDTDAILIAIGEVDCRWHLPYQAKLQNKTNEEIVKECIDRFFRAHAHLDSHGYTVIGWGGHPSTTSGHNEDPSNPVFGDCITRNEISKLWNSYLHSKCTSNQLKFVSIIEDLIDESGLTKMEYYTDYCHLDYNKTKDLFMSKFKEQNIISHDIDIS